MTGKTDKNRSTKDKINKKITLLLITTLIIFTLVINGKNNAEKTDSGENGTDEFAGPRKNMVEQQLKIRDITNEKVLAIMEKIERHKFFHNSKDFFICNVPD